MTPGEGAGVCTIAVIEDNPDNRLLVEAMLDGRYHVVGFETGDAALVGMRERRPDLILLDISLPGMDGRDVLAEIRADDALQDVPTIALTAHVVAGGRDTLIREGFDEYVMKPIVDEAVLIKAIERLLQ